MLTEFSFDEEFPYWQRNAGETLYLIAGMELSYHYLLHQQPLPGCKSSFKLRLCTEKQGALLSMDIVPLYIVVQLWDQLYDDSLSEMQNEDIRVKIMLFVPLALKSANCPQP